MVKSKVLKTITKWIHEPEEIISLGYGSKLIIPVYGEHYGQEHHQTTLKRLYKTSGGKVISFNLLPQNAFQKVKGWPEEPFLNVVPMNNFSVEKNNWLGYIAPLEPNLENVDPDLDKELYDEQLDRKKYVDKIVKLGHKRTLTIQGKVILEEYDGHPDYQIILFASHKEIDNWLNKLR